MAPTAHITPDARRSEGLARVPDGWLRADRGRTLRIGAVGVGLAALAMFSSAFAAIANPEVEHPERGWISGTVLAVFAFACWALGSARRKITHGRINIDNLDVAPRMLYTALRFYWRNPGTRVELGTTLAQRRMEAWAKAPQ